MDLWEAQLHAPIVDRGAHQHREGGSPHPKASPYARSQPRSSYLVKRVEGEPAALQIQAESKPKHGDQAAAAVFHTGLSHQCRTERCGQLLRDDKASARAKRQ